MYDTWRATFCGRRKILGRWGSTWTHSSFHRSQTTGCPMQVLLSNGCIISKSTKLNGSLANIVRVGMLDMNLSTFNGKIRLLRFRSMSSLKAQNSVCTMEHATLIVNATSWDVERSEAHGAAALKGDFVFSSDAPACCKRLICRSSYVVTLAFSARKI